MSFVAQNISVSYGRKKIINDISFDIQNGEMVGVLGENGSGKTTLIKALCGIAPYNGSVMLNEKKTEALSVRDASKLINYIPQKTEIDIDISVMDVVLLGFNPYLGILQAPTKDMIQKAEAVLATVGMTKLLKNSFMELSEGQKQAVIIARTLATNCELYMLDEPESTLDINMRLKLLRLIKDRVKSDALMALVAIHDINIALNLCDRILLLKDGQLVDTINVKEDNADRITRALQELYACVNVKKIDDRLVMLWD